MEIFVAVYITSPGTSANGIAVLLSRDTDEIT